jgi:hypothetical protein
VKAAITLALHTLVYDRASRVARLIMFGACVRMG